MKVELETGELVENLLPEPSCHPINAPGGRVCVSTQGGEPEGSGLKGARHSSGQGTHSENWEMKCNSTY